jgi:CubicO group peptidase (beta-lactamase class C family)
MRWSLVTILTAVAAVAHAADFSALDELALSEMKRLGVPGASIAIVEDGKVVHARGYGVRSIEESEPVTADTLFRLGSTTKMFTAAGLVCLAEEGKIKLDAPIGGFVKGLHPDVAKVTAHQLLTHTAGLADTGMMTGPHDESALKANVLALGEKDFFEDPGRIYSYSNPGYWVAGFVQEELAEVSYAEHLRQRIFVPLGMERSTFSPLEAMTWPLAIGHEFDGARPPKVVRPLADHAGTWPAGQMFTTAPEFARFCVALMNEGEFEGKQVFPTAVVEKLCAPHVEVPCEERHYGYGLGVLNKAGLRWLSHAGSRTGYGSIATMCPGKKFAVVILCNKTGMNLSTVAEKAAEVVLGVAPTTQPQRPPLAMTEAEMKDFAGMYVNGSSRAVLKVEDGKLVTAEEVAVSKVGENRFVRPASEKSPAMEFSFVRDTGGRITHLMSRGRAMKRVH